MRVQAEAPSDATVEATPAPAQRPRASVPLVVLGVLAVVAALHFAKEIFIPILFAVLLALLLRPILRRMRRMRMPNFVSAFVLIAAVAIVFVFGVFTLAGQAQNWLSQAPQTVERVAAMLPSKLGPMADIEKTKQAVQDLTRPDGVGEPLQVEVASNDLAYTVLGVSSQFVAAAVIVFVLAYFLLALSDTLLRQALGLRGSLNGKRNVVQLVHNVEQGVSKYLLTITVINIGLGIVTGLALWMLGIPNPVLWGVMAGTLNYVPHVGAFICLVVLFFVGAVTHESIGYGGLVAGVFVFLTSVESYFITPMVLSRSLQLSPLAVILAILFWGWLWGIPGGLVAAPLVAVFKIICDQVDSLRGWSAFLAGEAPANGANGASEATASPAKQAA